MQTLEQLRNGDLHGARSLKLCEGLSAVPAEIFALAETLEILDLSGNALSALPHDLSRLRRLRILFCSGNPFTALPEVLGEMPELEMVGFRGCGLSHVPAAALPARLRWLILTDNRVEELPEAIGNCGRMQKLMLAGNRLTALPDALTQCRALELLRIAANGFAAFPTALLELPRLSWLACAGNPFNDGFEVAALRRSTVPSVEWDQVELLSRLGEGASGVIHAARHGDRDVAVKVFKDAVTSDGLPASEMAAGLAAGRHPNLIPVSGRVSDGRRQGLMMDLLGPQYRSLAGPPSFETCTRDVYGEDTSIGGAEVVAMAQGVARAAAHLHRAGILNGDLYAHNILHDGMGHAYLSDLGAASFYAPDDTAHGHALQRLDVRAYGCLLEELAGVCSDDLPRSYHDLTKACLSDTALERPLFAEAEQALAGLQS